MKKIFISFSLGAMLLSTGCSMIGNGETTIFVGDTVNKNNDARTVEIACGDTKVFVVPVNRAQKEEVMTAEEEKAYDALPKTGKDIQNALNTLFKTEDNQEGNPSKALEKSSLKVKEIIVPDNAKSSFLIHLTGTISITDNCNKKIAKSQITETVRNLSNGQGFVLKLNGDARKFEKAFE
jgi:hypothetical protein